MSKQISYEERKNSDFITRLTNFSQRYVPDAMVFVMVLTVIVYLLAMFLTGSGPIKTIDFWTQGFWALLTFSMQMTLLLITGYVVADSKPVKKVIRALASIPKTPAQAIIFITVFAIVTWWLHWGVGMMASIVLGREMALIFKGKGLHYPSIVAAIYVAIVACNGPAQAGPLLVATKGHFMEKVTGIIPLSETVFHPQLLTINLIFLITLPILLVILLPKKENAIEIDDELAASFIEKEEKEVNISELTPAERWDRSPIFFGLVAVGGLFWIGKFLYTKGFNFDINTLNFTFLILGMILQKNPYNFLEAVKKAIGSTFGIIIQFPFYAGIFGMINFSGLAHVFANWFVSISTAHTYPWIVMVYSAFLNFFVPSGGSKFVIEAPYIFPAAQQIGANMNIVVNAYTSGDLLTNLIQPFWALPLMGAFKLTFRQIIPFGLIAMLWSFIVLSIGYLVFPLIFSFI